MNELSTCQHGNSAPASLLDALHPGQGGMARHKCSVCAYALALQNPVAGRIEGDATLEREKCPAGNEAPAALLALLPDSQAKPARHKCAVCAYAAGWRAGGIEAINYPDDAPVDVKYPEGAVQRVLVDRYERDPEARRKCIERYGYTCSGCDRTLESVYGPAGQGFIHVHHLQPLSEVGPGYQVDPITDLRPVCPNCHAMIHRRRLPFSIDELRAMLKAVRDQAAQNQAP